MPQAHESFQQYRDRMRGEPIYVILGVQGSGTNLLGRLLAKLFGFSIMRDRAAVFNAAARLGASPTRADVEREIDALERMFKPSLIRRKVSKHVLRKAKPLQGLGETLRASSITSGAEFARLVYTYRAYSLGAAHIGIKSDDIWENLHLVDHVIPNRRVILLTRDFRDNLVSVGGKPFGPVEPICAARYVKKQLAHYAAEFRRAGANGYHLKYETLLNDTREFVEDFSRHFDVAPVVDLDVAIPALRFRPNKIGKWKVLPQRQLAWCEGILHDDLLAFGYGIVSNPPEMPTSSNVLAAGARDSVKRFPQKVKRLMARMRN